MQVAQRKNKKKNAGIQGEKNFYTKMKKIFIKIKNI